ncbi:hypothetical protein FACS1894139_07300 [Planctomycetales bacterium]|nr:hypothetical protein FACS1894107_11690 [Planctomycetales bacterium]GHT01180.1 hypothetical protein FACS1894108_14590 [Planctomycetales bacterium]GHT04707.1 hypothetical protein FACS1894139_07300 [Planctomycetales bacterium]
MNVQRLWFAEGQLWIAAENGEVHRQPLRYYPRLQRADAAQRAVWEQTNDGLHWLAIDEDVSFESFFYTDDDPSVVSVVLDQEEILPR